MTDKEIRKLIQKIDIFASDLKEEERVFINNLTASYTKETRNIHGSNQGKKLLKKDSVTEIKSETEKYLTSLFNLIAEGVAIFDLVYDENGVEKDYIIKDANPGFISQVGIPKSKLINKPASDFYKTTGLRYLHLFAESVKTKRNKSFFYVSEFNNKHFSVTVLPLENDRFATISEEITTSKRMEEELANKFAFQESLQEAIPYAIFVKNAEGKFLGCNKTYEKEFGTTREYLMNKTVLELEYLPIEDRKNFHKEDMKIINEAGHSSYELPIMFADGKTHFTLYSVDGFRLSDGKPGGLIGIIIDITERKKVEEAHRISEEKFRALVENNFDIIWETDPDFIITYISPHIKTFLGFSYRDYINQHLSNLICESERPKFLKFVESIIKNPKPKSGIINNYIHKNGESLTMDLNCSPFFEESGKLLGFRGITRDISQLIKAGQEQEKLKNLESLSILAGGIAHDFRNILTVINGHASIALIKSTDETIKKNIEAIVESAKTAAGLTQQLFNFGKGPTSQKRLIPIGNILKEITSISLRNTNIKSELDFSETLNVFGDQGQIRQVLENIITNSIEAMPKGGLLKIRMTDFINEEKSYVLILISDNGIGIKETDLTKIFTPYYSTKVRHRIKGSGLGLAVCHSIISRHGGTITAKSQEGKGTTIEILLPASKNS